jgi:hypothetical protein
MTSPRFQIHYAFCKDLGACQYIGGAGDHKQCDKLERFLDYNDEILLHTQADKFRDEIHTYGTRRGGSAIIGGLATAAEMTEPFVKIEAFEGDPEEYVHPSEEHPDCPVCAEGVEHYHRKKDGSPLRLSDVPRETSGGDDASAT